MCGVFGILENEKCDVAKTIYYALNALQHRGQESAGIAVCDTFGEKGNISSHKGMGLVSEVFHEEILAKLSGNVGIGHVRYSTTGASSPNNAQPFWLNYLKGTLALVHNGNIKNAQEIRQKLENEGATFAGTTDSEVVATRLARQRLKSGSIEEAVKAVSKELCGGYALIVMSPRKLVGIRDPYGLKPLCIGRCKSGYVLSSESAAFGPIGAKYLRDVYPGEIVTITKDGVSSDMIPQKAGHKSCIFEYIYFARIDSVIDELSVYDARIRGGRLLARRYPADADLVTGVPESGITAAVGYSQEAGIPFVPVFYKNSYIGRTFIKPTQELRKSAVTQKLSVLESAVKGKNLVLIDDSIVRGTTISKLIEMLKDAGAKKVHVRISSPPFLYPCYYGTDIPSRNELLADIYSCEEIRKMTGADSLEYMHLEDLDEMVKGLGTCRACFDGNYPN